MARISALEKKIAEGNFTVSVGASVAPSANLSGEVAKPVVKEVAVSASVKEEKPIEKQTQTAMVNDLPKTEDVKTIKEELAPEKPQKQEQVKVKTNKRVWVYPLVSSLIAVAIIFCVALPFALKKDLPQEKLVYNTQAEIAYYNLDLFEQVYPLLDNKPKQLKFIIIPKRESSKNVHISHNVVVVSGKP
jgi:hypothetical protein